MRTDHLPDAQALLAFDALVRRGSFTAAAEELDCTKSRVSQLVKALEKQFGTVLVLRNTRRVALTETGQRLAVHARELRSLLERARIDINEAEGEVSGPLVISSITSFAQYLLAPILAELAVLHPCLQLKLQVENRLQDPIAEGLDFCIRTRNVHDDALVAKPLGLVREWAFASPDYLAKAPPLNSPDDLPLHRILLDTSRPKLRDTPEWLLEKDGQQKQVRVQPVLSSHQYAPLLSAAIAGSGVALLPAYVASEHLRSGRLVPVLPGWSHDCWPVYLVYPYRHPLPRKYEAFIQHVVPRMRALLEAGIDPGQGGIRPSSPE
ncbi:LysR family transcriptional regulator [Chromobacterium violaceum]|uniref:Gcv operon activator n=1 Tax=Chromobacterium violaceum TaxID=536 RepID=A0A202BDA7_CHRVL|nr:LysR family transcriptional regulator [Chromobacterium violaceum]ATP27866.1 LysR family transcriptional regulator [Chromobacterium violaceum]ATP31778.1 LysR family transcriptional regulator [Chromobacterium violaceum]OQS09430.1 LysR family transcriptional regulator [Chromobacterium violaceum]OQS25186.1 LysR family transcriptional regulator [Chromobacterium violaceum]OVE49534.1 LysR family transcriptional regulator [Chromobacterium violaceum]